MTVPNVKHSSGSDSWMTPISILNMARSVLGRIDLDPASSALANERVGAALFYHKDLDGLANPWYGSVFCNPPGGKRGNSSMTVLFWDMLMQERPKIDHAIFLCFSIEAMQTTQSPGWLSVGDFPICIPAKRIAFDPPPGVKKSTPSHANVIAYVPGKIDCSAKFMEVFSTIGCVR